MKFYNSNTVTDQSTCICKIKLPKTSDLSLCNLEESNSVDDNMVDFIVNITKNEYIKLLSACSEIGGLYQFLWHNNIWAESDCIRKNKMSRESYIYYIS